MRLHISLPPSTGLPTGVTRVMPLPRFGPLLTGLITSAVAKRLGARHATTLGLALTAWQLWQQYQAARRQATPYADGPAEGWTPGGPQTQGPGPAGRRKPRASSGSSRRWSGRRP